ncbi:hypothetical+protein [Methylocapsa aurea]
MTLQTRDRDHGARRPAARAFATFLLLDAAPAYAHTGVGATHGFAFGLEHPFGGLDHLAAMIAVGAIAARFPSRAAVAAPLAFVSFMAFGATLGALDVPPNLLQALTFNSMIILGVMLTTRLEGRKLLALAAIGAFGLIHGLAHGADAPQDGDGIAFLGGLSVATSVGHALGFACAFVVARLNRPSARLSSLVASKRARRS